MHRIKLGTSRQGWNRFTRIHDAVWIKTFTHGMELLALKVAYSPQTAYAGQLNYEKHTYGPSRVANIQTEIDTDHGALTKFAAAARHVLYADQQRLNAILGSDEFLSRGDKRNGRNRMRRNCAFIEGTMTDMQRRVSAYQYAIDRARIETPDASPAAAEGALNHLRDRGAALQYEMVEVCRTFDLQSGHRRRAAANY